MALIGPLAGNIAGACFAAGNFRSTGRRRQLCYRKWANQSHLTLEGAKAATDFTVYAVLWPERLSSTPAALKAVLNDGTLRVTCPDGKTASDYADGYLAGTEINVHESIHIFPTTDVV